MCWIRFRRNDYDCLFPVNLDQEWGETLAVSVFDIWWKRSNLGSCESALVADFFGRLFLR